jgi:hypothetical protein
MKRISATKVLDGMSKADLDQAGLCRLSGLDKNIISDILNAGPEGYQAQTKTITKLTNVLKLSSVAELLIEERPELNIIDERQVEIPPKELQSDQVITEWLDSLMAFKKSFSATNFIPKNQLFDKRTAKLALKIQALQHELGRHLRKV